MTAGSLFSGIGGMDLGLHRAGFRILWQCEKDPWCRTILRHHWPDIPQYEDVHDVRWDTGRPELIAGGFPCKQTSTAAAVHGRRAGLDGTDSRLWFQMLRIIEEIRPRWVLVENVSGVSTWAPQIEGGLAGLGYGVARIRASAWDAGACHLRRRVFFLAHADGEGLPLSRVAQSCEAIPPERRAAHRDARMQALSRVLRVDDGVPGGLDRARRIVALGNAVYPDNAQWIGECILNTYPDHTTDHLLTAGQLATLARLAAQFQQKPVP